MESATLTQLTERCREASAGSGRTADVAAAILDILGADRTNRVNTAISNRGRHTAATRATAARTANNRPLLDCADVREQTTILSDLPVPSDAPAQATGVWAADVIAVGTDEPQITHWAIPRIPQGAAQSYLNELPDGWDIPPHDSASSPCYRSTIRIVNGKNEYVTHNLQDVINILHLYAESPTYMPFDQRDGILHIKYIKMDAVYGCPRSQHSNCVVIRPLRVIILARQGVPFSFTIAPVYPRGHIPIAEREYVCAWIRAVVVNNALGMFHAWDLKYTDKLYDAYVDHCMVVLARVNFDECMEIMGFLHARW